MIETCVKKEKNTKELKEKFASAFIKGKLHETEIKADRVKVGFYSNFVFSFQTLKIKS